MFLFFLTSFFGITNLSRYTCASVFTRWLAHPVDVDSKAEQDKVLALTVSQNEPFYDGFETVTETVCDGFTVALGP